MNFFQKIITFTPTLYTYLKGVTVFHRRNYEFAIQKFEKCLKHPTFQNYLLYSYYGQALCAVDRLEESHKYLLKACERYEDRGWVVEEGLEYNLAGNTISALKHICENSGIEEGKQYFDVKLKLKEV